MRTRNEKYELGMCILFVISIIILGIGVAIDILG